MGIYNLEHFKTRDEALNYYLGVMKQAAEKTVELVNKYIETNDMNYLKAANRESRWIRNGYGYYQQALEWGGYKESE